MNMMINNLIFILQKTMKVLNMIKKLYHKTLDEWEFFKKYVKCVIWNSKVTN